MLELMVYPDAITLSPKGPIDAEIAVPGSKSLTNRALAIAALAEGQSTLRGALIAEDAEVMLGALKQLGFAVTKAGTTFTVAGQGGRIPAQQATLDLKLSGTSIRFLTALTALGQGCYLLDGTARMRQRPIGDLVEALNTLGARVDTVNGDGCPPVRVRAQGLAGGRAQVAGDKSSQYLSALLMAAPYARAPVTLEVTGTLQSKPFIDMTLALMADFGVRVVRDGYRRFEVAPQRYTARDYPIEGDAMAAGYFWAIAAATGGRIKVTNVGRRSLQGDRRLAEVLAQMGCTVRWQETSCEVIGPQGRLRGGSFDLNDMPDQAQTLAVLALFADRPVAITNVWNLRIKETDRLSALSSELRKFGVQVDEGDDSITVYPLTGDPPPVAIDTYGDHRMAMAFAVAGMRLAGITIRQPACVAKTFPDFFARLAAL